MEQVTRSMALGLITTARQRRTARRAMIRIGQMRGWTPHNNFEQRHGVDRTELRRIVRERVNAEQAERRLEAFTDVRLGPGVYTNTMHRFWTPPHASQLGSAKVGTGHRHGGKHASSNHYF